MNLRAAQEFVGRHALAITAGVAAITCTFALIAMLRGDQRPITIESAYYFDLNTNQLVVKPLDSPNPVELDSGPHAGEPAGIRAFAFSCGGCTNPSALFGYLEKPGPSGQPLYTAFDLRQPTPVRWVEHPGAGPDLLPHLLLPSCNNEEEREPCFPK